MWKSRCLDIPLPGSLEIGSQVTATGASMGTFTIRASPGMHEQRPLLLLGVDGSNSNDEIHVGTHPGSYKRTMCHVSGEP